MQIHVYTVLIPILLTISALFAASEASLFSLSRFQLETLRESHPNIHRAIRRLIFKPDALLSTIIIGNETLNILIGTFIAELIYTKLEIENRSVLVILSTLFSSILLLTFSEILPKVLAFRMPIFIGSILVYPLGFAHMVLTPLRTVFLGVSQRVLDWIGIRPSPPSVINEKDFLTLVEVGAESGSLGKEEKQLIYNVFHFSDLQVSAVMTPWKGVISVFEDELSVSNLVGLLKSRPYSRVPVLSKTDNKVMGILYTKELLKWMLVSDSMANLEKINSSISTPYIVSSHKQVSKLFREFRQKKVHMALVVDEYGQHTGVITLEDVLNALFQTQKKEAV